MPIIPYKIPSRDNGEPHFEYGLKYLKNFTTVGDGLLTTYEMVDGFAVPVLVLEQIPTPEQITAIKSILNLGGTVPINKETPMSSGFHESCIARAEAEINQLKAELAQSHDRNESLRAELAQSHDRNESLRAALIKAWEASGYQGINEMSRFSLADVIKCIVTDRDGQSKARQQIAQELTQVKADLAKYANALDLVIAERDKAQSEVTALGRCVSAQAADLNAAWKAVWSPDDAPGKRLVQMIQSLKSELAKEKARNDKVKFVLDNELTIATHQKIDDLVCPLVEAVEGRKVGS